MTTCTYLWRSGPGDDGSAVSLRPAVEGLLAARRSCCPADVPAAAGVSPPCLSAPRDCQALTV